METEFIRFTRRLAEESGRLINQYFRRADTRVDYKSDRSPVTEADRRAEELMREMIRREYPDHGVIGEELGTENPDVLGAIHQPVVGDLAVGDLTRTRLNGKDVRVRSRELSKATLLTTDVRYVSAYQDAQGFEDLAGATGLLRTWGDCYGYLLVASGGADIMLDPIMSPWDLIPLVPIIRGAGGEISSWDGGDAVEGTSCVAASASLHPRIIGILNRREA
jgi:fructose-1,6-bisphosphatase/inositol monophosphatase family enzyme